MKSNSWKIPYIFMTIHRSGIGHTELFATAGLRCLQIRCAASDAPARTAAVKDCCAILFDRFYRANSDPIADQCDLISIVKHESFYESRQAYALRILASLDWENGQYSESV